LALIGAPPDEVVLAPPYTVLKTSSGKIRRAASRELYERGDIGAGPRPVWRQLARLGWAALAPQWRRSAHAAGDILYAGYAWLVFWALAPWVWLAVALLPSPAFNRVVIRAAARLLIRLCALPIRVEGLDQPLAGSGMLVANHASYIDGIVLAAVLPPVFCFVAKGELAGRFAARVFLRRIGAEFVERFDFQRGVEDARRLTEAVRAGRRLIFFPEGTFDRMPGLLPFHLGAFAAAAAAGVPVVPVAIRGTRSVLRSGQWFPRRGAIRVTVGAPLVPQGSDWSAAIKLRDAARAEILKACGEPDVTAGPAA
jgi:1-acyl-sn-glycerol-3-phosphate acyltransferase